MTVRPLRPPQRARLLEKWIRVAEVSEDRPAGDCGVEGGPTAAASRCDPTGVPPAPEFLFRVCCRVGPAVQPRPQASSSLGGSSQVGGWGPGWVWRLGHGG